MINVVLLNIDPQFEDINNKYLKDCTRINLAAVFDDPDEVVKYLESNTVEAVFIDCDLRAFDIPAFIKQIKDRKLNTRFVVTTVTNDAYEITKVEYAGVFDVVVKPFSYSYFLKIVDSLENQVNTGGSIRESGDLQSMNIRAEDMGELETSVLSKISEKAMAVSELAAELGISRITVQKCINYLMLKRTVEICIDDVGNPVVRYRKKQLF